MTATQIARHAIGRILDGHPPNGDSPADMGECGECYIEVERAYSSGGTDAARRVFAFYAERDHKIAALIAGDPEPPKQVWSTADLLSAEFPDPVWAVPELLPAGLVVLAGRPKLGKSWLSLQIATAVGSGGDVLGRPVKRGHVLYLALEDNPRRIQDRLRKQRATATAAIDWRFEWLPLVEKRGGDRGTQALITAIEQHKYTVVIIDTISRALGHADQLDQADMNVAFGSLQRLAIENDICLLLVDHHRKSAGGVGDVIDDVMGATSKVGVADAAIGIYRERGQSNATLKVSGRDVDDQELAIQFDRDTFSWQHIGSASGVKSESVQSDIVTAIDEYNGEATAAEIAKFLGKKANNVTRELQELVVKGVVMRGEKVGRRVPYLLVGDS